MSAAPTLQPGTVPTAPSDDEPIVEPIPQPAGGLLARLAAVVGLLVVVGAIAWVSHLANLDVPPLQVPPRAAAPAPGSAPGSAPGPVPGSAAYGEADSEPVFVPAHLSPVDRVDSGWALRVADVTGIPVRAVLAYASADLTVDAEQPGCGLGWNTLAGIGAVESGHGSHGGAVLGEDGYPSSAIWGVVLDGDGVAAIRDSDGGVWDGDDVWDRAVGPMQFLPSTWVRWGADGNGDGVADPHQVDDAALAAARYLCASGSMTSVQGWRAAVFSYNHSDTYVDHVATTANHYATAVGNLP